MHRLPTTTPMASHPYHRPYQPPQHLLDEANLRAMLLPDKLSPTSSPIERSSSSSTTTNTSSPVPSVDSSTKLETLAIDNIFYQHYQNILYNLIMSNNGMNGRQVASLSPELMQAPQRILGGGSVITARRASSPSLPTHSSITSTVRAHLRLPTVPAEELRQPPAERIMSNRWPPRQIAEELLSMSTAPALSPLEFCSLQAPVSFPEMETMWKLPKKLEPINDNPKPYFDTYPIRKYYHSNQSNDQHRSKVQRQPQSRAGGSRTKAQSPWNDRVRCRLCQNQIMTNRLANLQNHARRHSKLKQFHCPYCPYAHTEVAKVRLHIEHNHTQENAITKREPLDLRNEKMEESWALMMRVCFPDYSE